MQSSAATQQSCTDGQGNCFFSVNKEKQEKNKQEEEEDNFRTTMQSSTAVQQSCTRGEGNCCFLFCE